MIRALVADDQALVRGGFRMILDAQADIEVAGEADNGRTAVTRTLELRPDIVLMDVRMPVLDGIQATAELVRARSPAKIMMLTTFDLDEYVYAGMKAGASGFLLKDVDPPDLTAAVRCIVRGDTLLSPTLTRRLVEQYLTRPAPGAAATGAAAGLTARELDVLRLIARGLSNAEIGAELYLAEPTVKAHVTRMLAKLGLRDRVQAVVYAYESGLIQPGHS
ncbi:MAG: response regulator transcription factor [Streptosporangiaceae bacterium]